MEQHLLKRKEIVSFFLKKNLLVSSEIIQKFEKLNLDEIYNQISGKIPKDFLIFDSNSEKKLSGGDSNVNWTEFDRTRALYEKGRAKETYTGQIPEVAQEQEEKKTGGVKIIFSYEEESKKRGIQDFVEFFNNRYRALEKILRGRQELQSPTSIKRIMAKKGREAISFIGMVNDKQHTKNNNVMFTLEDPTGTIKVLVNKTKPELYEIAKSIVNDEVIGVVGVSGDNIVFANNLIWPDIPTTKELKKSTDDIYAIFLSDIHVGSNNFLSEDFNKFLKWISGKTGNDKQREIASKVRYLFVIGDIIDGCGIYPEQDKELIITDVYEQYKECARLLREIPSHIQIILCPGNHDAMRIAEPQPPLYKEFAGPLYELKNVVMISNPGIVNIHASENFPGFDVLLYHGYSFDYFVSNVDMIRNGGGYDRADLIMKFLLQKRHLAPTHTSNLYIPDTNRDPLVIEKAPDFFVTGHIHKSIVGNYRNTTLISGSCWQSKTAFQEKVGHNPEPSRVPIVNLMTRETKILKFGK